MNRSRTYLAIFSIFSLVVIGVLIYVSNIAMNSFPDNIFMHTKNSPMVTTPTTTRDMDSKNFLVAPDPGDPIKIKEYEESVIEHAIATTTLTIGKDCVMSPLILRAKNDAVLTISNVDDTAHTIAFEDLNLFTIAKQNTINVSVQSLNNPIGIHRYRCNDKSFTTNVGILYVTKD